MKPPTISPILAHNYNKKMSISGRPQIYIILFIIFLCLIAIINVDNIENLRILQKHAFSGMILSNMMNVSCNNNQAVSVSSSSSSTLSNNYINNNSTSNSSSIDDEMRILVGVLTLPDHYGHRDFLRRVYKVQPRPVGSRVDVRFVFCSLTTEEQKLQVSLEIMSFNDIIILNCTENMDDGKTYTYFSSLPEILISTNDTDTDTNYTNTDTSYTDTDPPYHYVMKADDDTFVRVEGLVESLRPLARDDLYYGYALPGCKRKETRGGYMAGMGYLVSWDIVKWVKDSDIPRNNKKGPEDFLFGKWLNRGKKANNRFNAKWKMYDYPNRRSGCSHEFWSETVAIHQLKTQDRWINTLNYFNLTKPLKPSRLYHISI